MSIAMPPSTDRAPPNTDQSMTQLVTGAIADVQELVKQQLALFKVELRDDLRKAREAGLTLSVGLGLVMIGAILLGVMLAELLHAVLPSLPLWACFGIIGGAVVIIGAILIFAGKKQFESVHLAEQSVKSLKENVQWMQNPQ